MIHQYFVAVIKRSVIFQCSFKSNAVLCGFIQVCNIFFYFYPAVVWNKSQSNCDLTLFLLCLIFSVASLPSSLSSGAGNLSFRLQGEWKSLEYLQILVVPRWRPSAQVQLRLILRAQTLHYLGHVWADLIIVLSNVGETPVRELISIENLKIWFSKFMIFIEFSDKSYLTWLKQFQSFYKHISVSTDLISHLLDHLNFNQVDESRQHEAVRKLQKSETVWRCYVPWCVVCVQVMLQTGKCKP